MINVIAFSSPRDTTSPIAPRPESTINEDDEIAEGLSDTNLRLLDAVFHNAGLIASEDPSPLTPEEQEDIDALTRFVEKLTRDR